MDASANKPEEDSGINRGIFWGASQERNKNQRRGFNWDCQKLQCGINIENVRAYYCCPHWGSQ